MTWEFDPRLASQWVLVLITLLVIEAVGLAWWSRRRPLPRALGWHLGAGAFLAFALRAAIERSSMIELGVCLAGAGVCHAVSLWRSGGITSAAGGGRRPPPPPPE